ncbi:MAG: MMPL family transporter, partial [Myxococcota bacterium]
MEATDNSVGARLSQFVVNRWYLALPIALISFGGFAMGLGKIQENFTHTAFFWETDPLLERFNQFERQFGNDDSVILVVSSPSGIFDAESAELMRGLTEAMWKIPDVIQVESITNFSWVHADGDDIVVEPLLPDLGPLDPAVLAERKQVALEHEILPDYLVSKDGTIGLIFGRVKPGIDAPPDASVIVNAVRALAAENQIGDHRFHISGGPAINNAFKEISEGDFVKLVPVVLGMVILFLLISFRAVGGVLMPLAVILTSVLASFALVGWLNGTPLKTEVN